MIITIASFKGGVGKSTTAIHLAAYLAIKGKTVLADGDLNRSVLHWSERGKSPIDVYDHNEIDQAQDFEHLVIDTPARPASNELKALANKSDLLIIPTHPSTFALEALIETVGELNELPPGRFKVLLTCVPPSPSRDGYKARESLEKFGLPLNLRTVQRYFESKQDTDLEKSTTGVVLLKQALTKMKQWQQIEPKTPQEKALAKRLPELMNLIEGVLSDDK